MWFFPRFVRWQLVSSVILVVSAQPNRGHESLRELFLGGNVISDEGEVAIREALKYVLCFCRFFQTRFAL